MFWEGETIDSVKRRIGNDCWWFEDKVEIVWKWADKSSEWKIGSGKWSFWWESGVEKSVVGDDAG